MSHKVSLEKHKRYKRQYGKNEVYWGIGIENEMYLEYTKKARVSQSFFLKNHARERYSVDYYTSYRKKLLDSAFYENYHDMTEIDLPLLLNSHSFTKTDRFNQPQTTYEKEPKPNPLFCGETLHEYLMKNCPYFSSHYNVDFVYDGDTIEFITQDFYKTNVSNVLRELDSIQENFVNEIRPFLSFDTVNLMSKNHPFAIYMTNMKNVTMFNNGTYHINITLPTLLNDKGDIDNREVFVKEHQNAIRLLQLFEPVFMAIYGSPDPFHKSSFIFSPASQRCAVSRYIGLGTYSSENMATGKLLNIKTSTIPSSFWYHQYHVQSAYTKLREIGIDINFNKHHYHGIELRIFDYFSSKEMLYEVMEFIVYLLDHSLQYDSIHDVVKTKQWNEMVINCMRSGKNTVLCASQMYLFNQVFNTNYRPMPVTEFYKIIRRELESRYRKTGVCSQCMLDPIVEPTFNPIVEPITEPKENFCFSFNKMNKEEVIEKVTELKDHVTGIVAAEAGKLKTEVTKEVDIIKNLAVSEAEKIKNETKNLVVTGADELKTKVTDLALAEATVVKDKLKTVKDMNGVKNLLVEEAEKLETKAKDIIVDEAHKLETKAKDLAVAEAEKLEMEALKEANIVKDKMVNEANELKEQLESQAIKNCCVLS